MTTMDLVLGILGLVLTVMIFSYILGDNYFFRIALYLLVGVSAGYSAAVLLLKVIIPYLIDPLKASSDSAFVLGLIPLLLCGLLLLMLIPRSVRAGRLPLAFLAGIVAAVSLAGISRGTVAPQLLSILNRFSPTLLQQGTQPDWAKIFEAFTILLGVVSVLFFFHHRLAKKTVVTDQTGLLDGLSNIGQLFLGITFGMFFVGFYSTALVALISRLSWLIDFISALIRH